MLTQLRHASPGVKGVVFGNFTKCEAKTPTSFDVNWVLQDFANLMDVPALADLQHGHLPKKLTLPIGLRARIDANHGTFELLENAVI